MNHASSMLMPFIVPIAALGGGLLLHPTVMVHPAHGAPGHSQPATENVTLTTTTTTIVHASNSGNGHYGSHLVPILKAINATPDQKVKIKAIMEQFRPAIEPVMVSYHTKRDEFLQAIMTGKPAEDIMDKQCQMNELYDKITNEYCVMNLKVRKLLTAKQCDELQAYRKAQGWVK
ncbi:MAG TPA: hypothetical protein V6C72_09620 [Chroococcales cyanobacterium]